jgi:hypothetical protein
MRAKRDKGVKVSFEKSFWPILCALLVFNWLHPFTPAGSVETAYFIPQGHKGQDDYLGFYKMQYSADRATQTVITYGGSGPHAETQCLVLSVTTWQCDGMGADDGEMWYGMFGQPARHSVGQFHYYFAWLLAK